MWSVLCGGDQELLAACRRNTRYVLDAVSKRTFMEVGIAAYDVFTPLPPTRTHMHTLIRGLIVGESTTYTHIGPLVVYTPTVVLQSMYTAYVSSLMSI
jgi:hypothetical protein